MKNHYARKSKLSNDSSGSAQPSASSPVEGKSFIELSENVAYVSKEVNPADSNTEEIKEGTYVNISEN